MKVSELLEVIVSRHPIDIILDKLEQIADDNESYLNSASRSAVRYQIGKFLRLGWKDSEIIDYLRYSEEIDYDLDLDEADRKMKQAQARAEKRLADLETNVRSQILGDLED